MPDAIKHPDLSSTAFVARTLTFVLPGLGCMAGTASGARASARPMRRRRPRSLLLLLVGSLAALAAWAGAETPLDSWLAGLELPPALGVTLRHAGYEELGALTDGAGAPLVTEQQLKDWKVLPWHRRKLLGALATLAEERVEAAEAGAEAAEQAGAAARAERAATVEAEAARLAAEATQAAGGVPPAGAPAADAAGSPSGLEGSYAVRLTATADPGPEQALGLLLEDVPWHGSPLITGVVVGGPAHAAGVLPGSTVLSVDGAAPVDATVTALLATAVAKGASEGVSLALQAPAPLVQGDVTHAAGAAAAAAATQKGSKGRADRRGKRGKAGKKGTKGDSTARLHTALQRFSDMPLATSLMERALRKDASAQAMPRCL